MDNREPIMVLRYRKGAKPSPMQMISKDLLQHYQAMEAELIALRALMAAVRVAMDAFVPPAPPRNDC